MTIAIKSSGNARNFHQTEDHNMTEHQIVDSSFTAIINAPIEKIDIPEWCFGLSEQEYQSCSPAHIAAGFTTAPDGKRMSINVEIIGGSMIVEHYIETFGGKSHLILDSTSDVFTPTGRTTIHVTWELRRRRWEVRIHEPGPDIRNRGSAEFPGATGHPLRSISCPAPACIHRTQSR